MKTTATVARILLGLVFFAAGLSGFLLISHPPAQPPGLAGEFQDVFFRSYWVLFVDGVELIAGLFLLSNRYVPLALTLLGPVIVNILSFHMFLDSENMAPAIVVTVLWIIVFLQVRSSFAGLFVTKKAGLKSSSRAEPLGAA